MSLICDTKVSAGKSSRTHGCCTATGSVRLPPYGLQYNVATQLSLAIKHDACGIEIVAEMCLPDRQLDSVPLT
nr:hypothetical protein CFP56_11562 [Quercus suber]